MMMKSWSMKRWLVLGLAVAVPGVCAAQAAPSPGVPDDDAGAAALAPSSTVPGAAAPGSWACLIQPYQTSEIGSASPGVIRRVLVERGDVVHKGEVVVELNSEVDQATLALRQSEAAYLSRVVGRNTALFKKNLLPAKDYDEMVSKLRQAEQQVQLQKVVLAERSIRSPFDGVVAERFGGPGDRVNDNKILKLAQIDPLLVKVVVPEGQYGKIRVDEAVAVHVNPAISAQALSAKVWRIDKVMDAASGTFTVLLKMDNPGMKIPAGIRCTARF
ncbi:hypothetical protein CDEF62S_03697 [Castellaniella defragrans]